LLSGVGGVPVEKAVPDARAALIVVEIPGLRRFAKGLVRGDRARAEDLLQDGLERALAHWHDRRAEGNLRSWLHAILYNRFVSEQHLRRRRGMPLDLSNAEEAEVTGIDGGQDAVLHYRDFLRGFRELPQEQRSVLYLVGVEGLSYREVARRLGVPIGTVMSRLSRARDRLRRHLDGQDRAVAAAAALAATARRNNEAARESS
jgi:RNA polymerase sigma factor (sigma-70 family)